MTKEELYSIEKYSYSELCSYLIGKYGICDKPYFKKNKNGNLEKTKGKQELCLHRHHVYENEIPNLSNIDVAKEYDLKYQKAENLVYCNLLEHFLLHFKINQEYDATLGIGGDLYIIRELNDCFFNNIETYSEPIKCLKQEYVRLLKDFYNLFPQYEHIICKDSNGNKIEEISK